MATVPPLTEGAAVHHADLNFSLAPPSMYCYQNVQQATIGTAGTGAVITYDTNVYDTDTAGGTHSTSTNTSRWTPLTIGYYLVVATLTWTGNATGVRQLDVRKNAIGSPSGGTRVGLSTAAATPTLVASNQFVDVVQMNGTTDYLEMFGYQTSGGNLGVFSANQGSSWVGSVSLVTRWLNS